MIWEDAWEVSHDTETIGSEFCINVTVGFEMDGPPTHVVIAQHQTPMGWDNIIHIPNRFIIHKEKLA